MYTKRPIRLVAQSFSGRGKRREKGSNTFPDNNHPIDSLINRTSEGIKRKCFELGKFEYPILSALNTGIAGTSAPSLDGQETGTIYTWLGGMLG